MTHHEIQQQALANARNNASMANYAAIFQGFAEKGIPENQIEPRVNVFTFHAWKALGRQVRKGEHGVKVCTYIPMDKVVEKDGERKVEAWKAPRMTTVFHISQTDETSAGSANMDDSYSNNPGGQKQAITQRVIDREPAPSAAGYYSEQFTPTA